LRQGKLKLLLIKNNLSMKNTLFICLFAMFALSGCVDDEEEFATGGNISPELTPENKENAVLNTAVFDQLNLDYPGLEKAIS
jgi:heparan-sulfate lyase